MLMVSWRAMEVQTYLIKAALQPERGRFVYKWRTTNESESDRSGQRAQGGLIAYEAPG
jgi:hypothetical protein